MFSSAIASVKWSWMAYRVDALLYKLFTWEAIKKWNSDASVTIQTTNCCSWRTGSDWQDFSTCPQYKHVAFGEGRFLFTCQQCECVYVCVCEFGLTKKQWYISKGWIALCMMERICVLVVWVGGWYRVSLKCEHYGNGHVKVLIHSRPKVSPTCCIY